LLFWGFGDNRWSNGCTWARPDGLPEHGEVHISTITANFPMNPIAVRFVIDLFFNISMAIDHCIGCRFVESCSTCCDACVLLGPPKWSCVVCQSERWECHDFYCRIGPSSLLLSQIAVCTVIHRQHALAANLRNGLRITQRQHQAGININDPIASGVSSSWSSRVPLTLLQHGLIFILQLITML
jgi:hypothetical protein